VAQASIQCHKETHAGTQSVNVVEAMTKYFGNGLFGDDDGNIEFERELDQFEWFTEGDYHVWRHVDCRTPLAQANLEWFEFLYERVNQSALRKIESTNENNDVVFWIQIF